MALQVPRSWTAALAASVAVIVVPRFVRWLARYKSLRPVFATVTPDYLSWSASDLARAIRTGTVRSVEVVDACISALESTSVLNAIVTERFAAARAEAKAADERVALREELLPPFLGVPILLKEAFEYPNMQYTNGIAHRRGCLGSYRGPVVQRVEEAGFIVLGFGNVSEACMWMESYNTAYGRTSSPFDLSCTPGGSSGGTAAGVAVLGAPVGITADIGGSTRIPALFCGLFGHKPTGGLVPNTGTHLDNCHGVVCRICQLGMVTRHAEDMLPLLKLMAGPPTEEEDPFAAEYLDVSRVLSVLQGPSGVDFSRLTVIPLTFKGRSLRTMALSGFSAPVRAGQERVVQWFAGKGCKVRPMFLEDLRVDAWFDTWADRNQTAGGPKFRSIISEGVEFGHAELVRYLLGLSQHTAPALALALLENTLEWFAPPRHVRLSKAQAVEDHLREALGDCGVFVLPILPRHGCKHDELLFRFVDSCFTSIWNAVECPATAIPLGLHHGLPVGIQVVSSPGNDLLTLAMAVELEQAGIARCVSPVTQ